MKNLNRYVLLPIMLLCVTMTYAQHDHSSHGGSHTTHVEQPPNGGVIKEAGKYKIEMVANMFLKKDQLRFYLFKGNFRAILNEGITGTITIKSNDKKTSTQSLQAKGNDFFVAQLQNSGSFQATVKFIIKGKTVSTVFIQNGIGHHSSASYTCSMHPEVKSDTFGTCPKCGMNLEKQ